MADSFMNRNVNLVLVFAIIFVVGVIAAGTVYFQDTFYRLTGKYSSTSGELKQAQQELAKYTQLYNDASLQLNRTKSLTEQEKSDLRRVYTVKNELSEQLNKTLTQTQADLDDTKQDLVSTSSALVEKTNQYNDALNKISGLETTSANQKTQISSLKNKVDDLEDDLATCQAQLGGG